MRFPAEQANKWHTICWGGGSSALCVSLHCITIQLFLKGFCSAVCQMLGITCRINALGFCLFWHIYRLHNRVDFLLFCFCLELHDTFICFVFANHAVMSHSSVQKHCNLTSMCNFWKEACVNKWGLNTGVSFYLVVWRHCSFMRRKPKKLFEIKTKSIRRWIVESVFLFVRNKLLSRCIIWDIKQRLPLSHHTKIMLHINRKHLKKVK